MSVVIIFIFASISFVLAGIEFGNQSHFIETNYGSSDLLRGWVNISLTDVSQDELIKGFGNNITIFDFLTANGISCISSTSCSCFPIDCEKVYSTIGDGVSSKSYSMTPISNKLIGIKLTGDISGISDFRFNISTNAPKSCLNPLRIDLLDDGIIDYEITELSDSEECDIDEPYGCFNEEHSSSSAKVDKTLCQAIVVPPIKGFKIGAIVEGSGDATFKMSLDIGADGDDCQVTTSSGGEISCIVSLFDDLIDYNEATVCISPDASYPGAAASYNIKYEDNETCGFIEETGDSHDFEIFAKPLKYDPPLKIVIDKDIFLDDENYLNQMLSDYISSKYGGECNPNCVIPIRVYSGSSQLITIKELFADFTVNGLNLNEDEITSFYEIEKSPILLSSDFIKLDLSKSNITTPSEAGEHDLILKIGEETIEKNISVSTSSNIKAVLPTSAVYLVPVKFKVLLTGSSANLTYDWNFGDNSTMTTKTNEVEHTYTKMGNFQLTLNVSKGSLWTKSKTITVKVQSPYDTINETLKEYDKRLDDITVALNLITSWIREKIAEKAKIQDLKDSITSIEKKYKSYPESYDEEHRKLIKELLDLDVPYELGSETVIPTMKFFQKEERLDLTVIEEEYGGSFEVGMDEEYYKAINEWLGQNLDITFESKDYHLYSDSGEELIYTYIKMVLTAKEDIDEFYMLLEGDPDYIYFKPGEDYGEEEIEGFGYGMTFEFKAGDIKTIELLYPSIVQVLDPPIFVSPEFRELNIEPINKNECNGDGVCDEGEDWKNCGVDCKPIKWILILLGILIFVALVIYIVLQEWYKKKYESHLFKNRNELFNLITFMNNATTQSMSKGQIFDMLSKKGWNKEQLTYAWKKLKGYRTGMWEIPLFKSMENKKVKEEIKKRQTTSYGASSDIVSKGPSGKSYGDPRRPPYNPGRK